MDPRPFHFDYRAPPHNISPTYFSDRLYSYLQPEQQHATGSSRYLRNHQNSRLSSPSSSLNYSYFDKDKGEKQIDELFGKNDSDHNNIGNYDKNKLNYYRRNLQNQLNTVVQNKPSRQHRRHESLNELPRNSGKLFSHENNQEEEELLTKTSQRGLGNNQIINQYNQKYNNYKLKLLPKSRYDPVSGGEFIDNRKILQRLNSSALSKYAIHSLAPSIDKNQIVKGNTSTHQDIGSMGQTITAPSPQKQKLPEFPKQMMGDFYKKYMFNQRYIQQKNEREYNIINGDQIVGQNDNKSQQNGSQSNRNRKSGISGISGFSSMKTKYLPMGRRQGFRRLGVKK